MKKIFILFLNILLLINIGFSCEGDERWQDNFANCFSQDPQAGLEKISENPNLIYANVNLLDNPLVLSVFESKIAGAGVSILNDENNAEVKRKWFELNGIKDTGAKIFSFDGTHVTTEGPQSTTFNVKDFPGSTLLPTGELVLNNGAKISNAEVTQNPDGSIEIKQNCPTCENSIAKIEIDANSDQKYVIAAGEVIIGGKIYKSENSFEVNSGVNGGTKITGKDVFEYSIENTKISSFTGSIIVYSDGHKNILANTDFNLYNKNELSRTYSSTRDTLYYNTVNKCDGTTNCIEDYPNPDSKLVELYNKIKEKSSSKSEVKSYIEEELNKFRLENFIIDSSSDNFDRIVELKIREEKGELSLEEKNRLQELINNDFVLSSSSHPKLKSQYAFLDQLQFKLDTDADINSYLDENKPIPNNIVKITANDNNAELSPPKNEIKLKVLDNSIDKLQVVQIKDESTVIFNEKSKVELKFTHEGLGLKGDPDYLLSTDISMPYFDEGGNFHKGTIINGGEISECRSPCKFCGSYMSQATMTANAYKNMDLNKMKMLKAELGEKWGFIPKDYLFALKPGNELFISAIYASAFEASKNKYGITLTPEEILTTFLAEGGVNIFMTKKYDFIPKTFNLDGKNYEIKNDGGLYYIDVDMRDGTKYKQMLYSSDIAVPITKEDKFVIVDGKKYEVKLDDKGKPYYYGLGRYYDPLYAKDKNNIFVSGIGNIGADAIGNVVDKKTGDLEIDRLKKEGFIPNFVQLVDRSCKNIDKVFTCSGDFNTIEEGVLVSAGVYADRKKQTQDFWKKSYGKGKLDKPWDQLTAEEQYYWTTVVYNGKTLSAREAILANKGNIIIKSEDNCGAYCNSIETNAQRRVVQLAYLKKTGLLK